MAGYTQSRLIYLALLKLGVINAGATPSATQIADATDALDDMIQEWQVDGLRTWVLQDLTIPLVAGQRVYTLGPTGGVVTPRPERLYGARRHDLVSGIDTPLVMYSSSDYLMLSNKDQTGTPIAIFYDKHIPNANLNIYLVPDAAAAAEYSVILSVQTPLTSVTSSTTDLQFPNAWAQALKWGLADELAMGYGVPAQLQQFVQQKAMYYKTNLENYDQEDASPYFTLDLTGQFRP